MTKKITDKTLLDELNKLGKEYGHGWICRRSVSGRGLRLHQTNRKNTLPSPRLAIHVFLEKEKLDG